MKIGVLGTGMVGETLATKLVRVGHQVKMGSRSAKSENATKWASASGPNASQGTFADAAAFGEIIFSCTNGAHAVEALRQADAADLRQKIFIDVSNPLDFSKDMPVTLTVCNTDSLAEQIQREFPDARVIKTLNTLNCAVMVEPSRVPGDHNLFVCGNDAAARRRVIQYLVDWFGWKAGNIIDLGDITAARGLEMWLPLWLRLFSTFGHPHFNLRIVTSSD